LLPFYHWAVYDKDMDEVTLDPGVEFEALRGAKIAERGVKLALHKVTGYENEARANETLADEFPVFNIY
jgi:hypothetical protein